jgi:hypothetical protein
MGGNEPGKWLPEPLNILDYAGRAALFGFCGVVRTAAGATCRAFESGDMSPHSKI